MKTPKLLTRAEVSAQEFPYAWPPEHVLNPGRGFNWKRTVAVDFHQVCTDWIEQYVAYLNKLYKRNIDHTKISLYNIQFDPSIDLTPAEHEEAFVSFARLSRGGYGSLKPYPGIKEAFRQILDAGIKIKVYTWTPGAAERIHGSAKAFGSGMAQRATLDLIASLDLGIDVERDVKFLAPAEKKWRMVEDHIPLLIEDNPETAVSVGLGIGHAVILVPEPQNEGLICPNVLRIADRKELGKTVVDFFAKLDEIPDLML